MHDRKFIPSQSAIDRAKELYRYHGRGKLAVHIVVTTLLAVIAAGLVVTATENSSWFVGPACIILAVCSYNLLEQTSRVYRRLRSTDQIIDTFARIYGDVETESPSDVDFIEAILASAHGMAVDPIE